MKAVLVATILLGALLVPGRRAEAGCSKDTDCKGDRICVQGVCTDPHPSAAGAGSAAGAPAPRGRVRARIVPAPAAGDSTHRMVPSGAPPRGPSLGAGGPAGPGAFKVAGAVFSPAQIAALRAAGALLDEMERQLAESLVARGYSPGDFVRAYQRYAALRGLYPELQPFGRGMLETVAVGLKLGLSREKLYRFIWNRHARHLPLTEAYNRHVVGGTGPLVAGWVVALLGHVISGLGTAMYVVDNAGLCFGPCGSAFVEHQRTVGWVFLGVGTAMILAGVPTLIVGHVRKAQWLAPDTLEKRPASLYAWRRALDSGEGPRLRLSVLPLLSPHGQGLSLSLSF